MLMTTKTICATSMSDGSNPCTPDVVFTELLILEYIRDLTVRSYMYLSKKKKLKHDSRYYRG